MMSNAVELSGKAKRKIGKSEMNFWNFLDCCVFANFLGAREWNLCFRGYETERAEPAFEKAGSALL